MGRTKERRKIIHEPNTHEIYVCLSGAQSYCRLLLENKPDKLYSKFLEWLLEIDFHNDVNEKISIKKIAAEFKTDTAKVTRWIKEMYEDLFELNNEIPVLFQTAGIKLNLYMKYYDNSCTFFTSMPVLPREFETFRFSFVRSKMGIDYFWVKKIEYELLGDEVDISVWLEGGFVNKYREFALDKALFHEWIGFMDVYDKHPFELDESIRRFTSTKMQPELPHFKRRHFH